MNKDFRFRGEEPGRLENFSDAVFALAVTLLLISTSAPTNIEQIKRFVWDLIPFCACIVLILLIWYQHFIFFYRYGLRNSAVITLNAAFLIIVLFYVYPLKFLAQFLLFPIGLLFSQELAAEFRGVIKGSDMVDLMIIYGLGAASISVVLVLMYRYALMNAEELKLNEIEKLDTRISITTNLLVGSIPLLSVLLAIIFRNHVFAGMFSGLAYFLYGPVMAIHGKRVDKKRKQLLTSVDVNAEPSLTDLKV